MKSSFILMFLIAAFCSSAAAQSNTGRLGDRLIVSINSLPYTQRQIEAYATVREAMRSGAVVTGAVVIAENWKDAVEVFTEEMIILQEAQRLGGFQAESRLTNRYQTLLTERMAQSASLRETLSRLGYHPKSLRRIIDAILRVATFRRSKERQPNALGGEKSSVNEDGPPAPASAPGSGGGPWLDDLKARAVVRNYEDAFRYVMIYPPQTQVTHER